MQIKSSKILIDAKTKNAILKNWKKVESESESFEVIDEVRRLDITLRVPMRVKGATGHMLISSRIEILERKNKIALVMYCNLIEPLIVSLIFGIALSALYYFTSSNLFVVVILAIATSVICFVSFQSSIFKRSSEFLTQLKEDNL